MYAIENYDIDVTLNYNHYTLQNRRLVSELLPLLQERRVGVINAAPFAQRLLTHTELPSWHPADNTTRELCRAAVLHCKKNRINPAKLCVQFSTRHPDMSTCVIGTGNPDDVREWREWLDDNYDEQRICEVEHILGPVMNRNSIYGRPENNDPIIQTTNSRQGLKHNDESRPDHSASVTLSRRQ